MTLFEVLQIAHHYFKNLRPLGRNKTSGQYYGGKESMQVSKHLFSCCRKCCQGKKHALCLQFILLRASFQHMHFITYHVFYHVSCLLSCTITFFLHDTYSAMYPSIHSNECRYREVTHKFHFRNILESWKTRVMKGEIWYVLGCKPLLLPITTFWNFNIFPQHSIQSSQHLAFCKHSRDALYICT